MLNDFIAIDSIVLYDTFILVVRDGKKRRRIYPVNPSAFWLIEVIKAEATNDKINDKTIETKRLIELANKHNLKIN